MASKLFIKCSEMASFPTGPGTHTNVVFKPKRDTDQNIRTAKEFGEFFEMTVEDNGGEHTTVRPHRIVSVQRERNVIIFVSMTR